MRVVVQRVSESTVTVEGRVVGAIGPGLLALVGVTHSDTLADVEVVAAKLLGLRIFRDESGKMNRTVHETGGEVLVVSQFTLYGDARRGRRPSFTDAAPPELAEPLMDQLLERLSAAGVGVASGRFGAMMDVEIHNNGPVTIVLETQLGRFI